MTDIKQTQIFLDNEADEMFRRTVDLLTSKTIKEDRIYQPVRKILPDVKGKKILEVGCGNGYRLNWFKKDGAIVNGVEPSLQAIQDGVKRYNFDSSVLIHSDAYSYFKTLNDKFDVIIFGFCIYLIPPEEIPTVVMQTINALNDGGLIVIYDFDSPPQRQNYHHQEGLYSYKARFDEYFTWFPCLRLLYKHSEGYHRDVSEGNPKDDCALSIIRKISPEYAFPVLEIK